MPLGELERCLFPIYETNDASHLVIAPLGELRPIKDEKRYQNDH